MAYDTIGSAVVNSKLPFGADIPSRAAAIAEINELLSSKTYTPTNELLNVPPVTTANIPILKPELNNSIPTNIATAANAFAVSMLQVKNVQQMNVEALAQVIPNLETIKDLDVNGTTIPVNSSAVNTAKSLIANGSGQDGTYTMCDFFGAMSGVGYNYVSLLSSIDGLDTTTLETIYDSMITLLSGGGPYDASLQTLITNAETEMQNIINSQYAKVQSLNTLYNSFGTQLLIEQNARTSALPNPDDVVSAQYPTTTISFVDQVPNMAIETQPCMAAQVLENISDSTTSTGQSLIGMMRESRNQARLELAGGQLDNNIPDVIPEVATNNLGLDKATGAPNTPGSLAGTPFQSLVPPSLDVFNITPTIAPSIYTPGQASDEVELCNCDCWQN